ncbi:tRNA U-34 5-methylaminomethyl-2-thiouridine biosynthesis protein MnmC, C-terminal domain [Beggiatoa alba B18LD]|uniref:tRNA 5-methylaminomethyl-2-thiouridine biosynthesis bifunctional protein MnmC n=1 Tax=Beggiatoa alba B18LD TaxID=395493 RepID=I3CKU6_9GAMM|nr:bifunctional tRNA (5-methylaminomethyl-2-thiouridine)(34)-methyltransferase MnmD/FAD-dependent 5-carboxymethylaminomethyl-2-thiouridine(34) oxidoreductase MnmC [Beggiatoa alba]EIJ44239.1 tRNA U-34 5-methylaminomethyl-2-thiouridine biosynthesis protein MnmC, C-terminal domain [Beggiatoa alba B18LD]
MNKQLYSAQLQWDADGNPYASQFQDIYFSKQGGLAETEAVFLANNNLPQRWLNHDFTQMPFTICETGFGTGLNFLTTCHHFLNQPLPAQSVLHFISIEKFPLSQADLSKALAKWAILTPYADTLLNQYPALVYGWHRRQLAQGRIVLTLGLGDVNELLANLYADRQRGLVDAWYLDGFAPAKNPEMWQTSLFEQMRRLSRSQATFSTFTAAGLVRRGLTAVGFHVEKVAGFAEKREMLRGFLPDKTMPDKPVAHTTSLPAWFHYPDYQADEKHAVIIGAGLAGTATAQALSRRGWRCTLLEAQPAIALGGSGNRQGVFYPLLSASWEDIPTQFYLSAYQFAQRHLQALNQIDMPIFTACGVLQLATTTALQIRFAKILQALQLPVEIVQAVSAQQASALAGISLEHNALYFPQAGWVATAQVSQYQLNQARQQAEIVLQCNVTVAHLQKTAESWQVLDAQGHCLAHAPVVIFTNAQGFKSFPYAQDLPLQAVRGQVSYAPANRNSQALKMALCYEGFITPAWEHQQVIGASYDLTTTTPEIRTADNQANIEKLQAINADLARTFPPIISARSAVRCSSLDHLPLIGALPDYAQFMKDYADLQHGRPSEQYAPPHYHQGLYVNLAHGSRGLLSAPFGAELLASLINHEPLPLPQQVLSALTPQRFWVRQLKRGK